MSKPETLQKKYMGKLSKKVLLFIRSLLCMDPSDRPSSSDCLSHSPYFDDVKPSSRQQSRQREESRGASRSNTHDTSNSGSSNGGGSGKLPPAVNQRLPANLRDSTSGHPPTQLHPIFGASSKQASFDSLLSGGGANSNGLGAVEPFADEDDYGFGLSAPPMATSGFPLEQHPSDLTAAASTKSTDVRAAAEAEEVGEADERLRGSGSWRRRQSANVRSSASERSSPFASSAPSFR